jgi:hypothetical protein
VASTPLPMTTRPPSIRGAQLDRFLYAGGQAPWAGRVPDGGVLTLVGHPGSGVDQAVMRVVEAERDGRDGFWLDARLYANRTAFVESLIARLVDRVIGPGAVAAWRRGSLPDRSTLAALGPDRARILSQALNAPESTSLAEVLSLAEGIRVGVLWAHLLAERAMDRLLWELRAAAASAQPITLVLSTMPATRGHVLGPDAAMFGAGAELSVENPTTARWRELVRVHALPVRDEDLLWVLLRSDGQALSTAETLFETRGLEAGDWNARSVWERRAASASAESEARLILVRSVAPYAPLLLGSIAVHDRPYTALGRFVGRRQVPRALSQLAEAGLVYQPTQRTWLLSEPLLRDVYAEWLIDT